MIVTTTHVPQPEKYPGGLAFGETIRFRRVGAGLTLRKCAEQMGVSMTTISMIEQGQMIMTSDEFDAFGRTVRAARDYRVDVYEASREPEGT